MSGRTLVAGIGNVFLGDDGFGVEVASRLAQEPLPPGVRVLDVGIRARHLAFELLDGRYDKAILVDAMTRGGAPGSVYVIEPDVTAAGGAAAPAIFDAHAMNPESTLAFVQTFGDLSTRFVMVGCEPACVDDAIGLSPTVSAAVDEALSIVRSLICA